LFPGANKDKSASSLQASPPVQPGENSVRRKDGSIEKLKGCDATVIDAGEAIIIQTPTAGGYGAPE
jgi:5-oxoprolinase (ATP-hydrolysing)